MVEDDQFKNFTRKLDEDGFFIWRNLCNHSDIDVHLLAYERVASEIDIHFLADKTPAGLPAYRAARDKYYTEDKSHQALCFHSQLIAFLRSQFGSEPVLRMVSTHLYNLGSHTHADCLNSIATDPWDNELRIWVALENVNPLAGPLYVYPRSHRLISESIRESMIDEKAQYHDWLIYDGKPYTEKAKAFHQHMRDKIEEGIKQFGIARKTLYLQKGDALVFNPAIIHGTAKPGDPKLTRKCMIFNHYASGTPFYSPGAFWGTKHDYRRLENEVHFEVERTSHGLRVINYMQTCEKIKFAKIVIE